MKTSYFLNQALHYAILRAAAQRGDSKAFSRKSSLTPETLIRLLIGAEGGSLDKVLHAAGVQVTASAVTQRRAQLDPAVFRGVFDSFNADCADNALFRGYRLLAVDGTTVNLPRNPASPSFVCHEGIPKGVNQLHLTPLYDILARTFSDAVIRTEPKKDEIGALLTMLNRNDFQQKTLIISDRGFESYNLIAHLLEKPNADFLIRVKQSRSAMREAAKPPTLELDCDVSFSICTTQKNADKANKNYVFLQVPKKSRPGSSTNVMSFKPQPRITPSFFRCSQLVYRFPIDNRKPVRYNKFTIYWRTRIFKTESHTDIAGFIVTARNKQSECTARILRAMYSLCFLTAVD